MRLMTEPAGLDLEAIERRHRAATPGPWHSRVEGRDHSSGDAFIQRDGPDLYLSQDKEGGGREIPSIADHDFIAGAYQDIAALVQEVRRLRRYEGVLDVLRSWRDTDLPMVEAIGDTMQRWRRVDSQEMAWRIVDTIMDVLQRESRHDNSPPSSLSQD